MVRSRLRPTMTSQMTNVYVGRHFGQQVNPSIIVARPSAGPTTVAGPPLMGRPIAGTPSAVSAPPKVVSKPSAVVVKSVQSAECTNCGVKTKDGPLCKYCRDLPSCRWCHRHLPSTHFCPSDLTLCQCCQNKQKYKSLQALGHVVTEVPLPVADTDVSLEEYFNNHSEEIREIVAEYHRQLR